jgi:hypothetical protein
MKLSQSYTSSTLWQRFLIVKFFPSNPGSMTENHRFLIANFFPVTPTLRQCVCYSKFVPVIIFSFTNSNHKADQAVLSFDINWRFKIAVVMLISNI